MDPQIWPLGRPMPLYAQFVICLNQAQITLTV